jgi:beta-galactosidase
MLDRRRTILVSLLTIGLLASSVAGLKIARTNKQSEDQMNRQPLNQESQSVVNVNSLKETANNSMTALERLIKQAKDKRVDTKREEAAVWMARQFLTYADWDESHISANKTQFEQVRMYKANSQQLAEQLPDLERKGVIRLLNTASSELTAVLQGEVIRRPVPVLKWSDVTVQGDQFVSGGRPVFLYDYFSKAQGTPTENPTVYNDYLGNIVHPSSVNPGLATNEQGILDAGKLKAIKDYTNPNIGYTMLWHAPLPGWAKDKYGAEMEQGRSIFTHYDIDHPQIREIWKHVLEGVVPLTQNKSYTKLGYILANEPHWFTAKGHWAAVKQVSTYTMDKFKRWLEAKHGSIGALNKLWGTNYSSFADVAIAVPLDTKYKGTPLWYDWSRFNMARGTEWLTFLHDEIKRHDPKAMTHIKIMPDLFVEGNRDHGIDLETLTELTEMIGDDAKIRKRDMRFTDPEAWEQYYSYYWKEMSMSYDFMASVSPGKPHVNSEVHFLSTSQYRDLEMKPEYVRSTYWLATIHGLNAGLTWFWARNPDGSIEERLFQSSPDLALGSSYAGSVAQQPLVAGELTRTMMDLNAFSEELVKFQRQEKPIRIFHSETSAINDGKYMEDQYHLYESMYFNGVPIGFATEKIIKQQSHSAWNVIVVHKSEEVTDDEFNALQFYLDQGGTLILDDTSLAYNEYKQLRSAKLKPGEGNLIKLDGNDVQSMTAEAFHVLAAKGKLPHIAVKEKNGLDRKGTMWRVVPNGDGRYLVTMINVGKNEAELELSLPSGRDATIVDMLTGKQLSASIKLKPEGVLLLEVKGN